MANSIIVASNACFFILVSIVFLIISAINFNDETSPLTEYKKIGINWEKEAIS